MYNKKRPSHPDTSHTKNKRWFKQKGRKRVRQQEKHSLEYGSCKMPEM